MVARRRLVAHLTTGWLATAAALVLSAPAAGADSICPTTLPGEVCAVVDAVVSPLVPTPPLPEPLPTVPVAPGPTSPVPSPSSPPSNDGAAPVPSTPPGAGAASPASHPAAPAPAAPVEETARGLDLPALDPAPSSPFVLGSTLTPYATPNDSSQLVATGGLPGGAVGDGDLPRPTGPITLAVLLLAGALGAHGVRWVDRQGAASASARAAGVDTGARQA